MVKGIINAFDHGELGLVINLTKGGNWAISQLPIFATGYVSFATNFIPDCKYLLRAKNLISKTG